MYERKPNRQCHGNIPPHHVNYHLPQGLPLLFAEVDKNITITDLHELERHGQVVILQHGLVIVHQRQL